MSVERIFPKTTLMYRIDKLSSKYWTLDGLSQGMSSSDDNKVHFTKTERVEIDHTTTGYSQSRREQTLLHEELAVRERTLRETRMRGMHEMEDLKRAHELRVDEFSEGKLIQNENTFTGSRSRNDKMRVVVWMIAVDNYLMFPVNLCYFLFLLIQDTCWVASEIRSLIYEYAWYIENISINSLTYSSSSYSEMSNSRDVAATDHLPVQASTGQLRSWKWWSKSRHNPNSEISTKFVSRKFIQCKWRKEFKRINFLRKLCCGSKKWRELIQCMI